MTAALEVSLDDLVARRALEALRGAIGDATDLMDLVGAVLEDGVLDRFETGAAPDGAAWPEALAARDEGRPTLVKSARLRDSIQRRASRDRVEVGTNVVYAAIHQFGGTIQAKTPRGLVFRGARGWARAASVDIPARPYLGLSREDAAGAAAAVSAHVERLLR